MSKESLVEFPRKLQTALLDGDYQYALRLFQDPKYQPCIVNGSWELIPLITEHLTESVEELKPEFYKACITLLETIAMKSNVEEVVLQFVSEVEETKNDTRFSVILDCLPHVIRRITKNKPTSLSWIFNSILGYLSKTSTVNLNPYFDLDDSECVIIDHNSPLTSKIVSLYNIIIIFFVTCNFSLEMDGEMMDVICKFLVELLGYPLTVCKMVRAGRHPGELLMIATEITETIFKVLDDPMKQVNKLYDFDSYTTANPVGVAHLFYLMYVKGVCYNLMPKVYQPTYLIKHCVILFNALLKENDFIIVKGLDLCNTLMLTLQPECLSYLVLDNPEQCKFFILITNIIVYKEPEVIRKKALAIFKMYLILFDSRGVYQVIINLFKTVTHSGLKGLLINYYKDRINEGILKGNLSPYFQGTKLLTLLKNHFCKLDKGEQTDLMQNSDQIIEALNLLRYLAIKESVSTTGFCHFESLLNEQFLEPLRRALELSREHYNLEIKTVRSAILNNTPSSGGMSPEDKLSLLLSSITVFDLMESLLLRVIELINIKEA